MPETRPSGVKSTSGKVPAAAAAADEATAAAAESEAERPDSLRVAEVERAFLFREEEEEDFLVALLHSVTETTEVVTTLGLHFLPRCLRGILRRELLLISNVTPSSLPPLGVVGEDFVFVTFVFVTFVFVTLVFVIWGFVLFWPAAVLRRDLRGIDSAMKISVAAATTLGLVAATDKRCGGERGLPFTRPLGLRRRAVVDVDSVMLEAIRAA